MERISGLALDFTVVTATTVGFGDYYPETFAGKVFTLFYVPVSVVAVAGAINHVAAVPLDERRDALENYVLAQFGENMTEADFDDIRRAAGIKQDHTIRSNDFVIAMSLRLGYMKVEDSVKIKRMFASLDRTGDGELTAEDIVNLIVSSPTKPPVKLGSLNCSSRDLNGLGRSPVRKMKTLGSRESDDRDRDAGLMESSQYMTTGSVADVDNPLAGGDTGNVSPGRSDGNVEET